MVDYCTFFVVLLSATGFSKSRLEGMGWILHTQNESRFICIRPTCNLSHKADTCKLKNFQKLTNTGIKKIDQS